MSTGMPSSAAHRPACQPRRRTSAATIQIRTQFGYADDPTGQPRVCRYSTQITDAGEFASPAGEPTYLGDALLRMVAAFGDHADLDVVVRRRRKPAATHTNNPTRRDNQP